MVTKQHVEAFGEVGVAISMPWKVETEVWQCGDETLGESLGRRRENLRLHMRV